MRGGYIRKVTFADRDSLIRRLEKDRLIEEDHWLWLGYCDRGGYGTVTIDGRSYTVSRVAAFIWLGLDIQNGLVEVRHKLNCEIRRCFNPNHLCLGSHEDNMRDVSNKVQSYPYYPCGHPRVVENTMPDKRGYKSCRRCHQSVSLNSYYIKKVHADIARKETTNELSTV
jgi:hypothetical protein